MADSSEPEKPVNSKKKAQPQKSKRNPGTRRGKTAQSNSASRSGDKVDDIKQSAITERGASAGSSIKSDLPVAAKRKRVDKFSLPPVPGTRTGLRSQDKSGRHVTVNEKGTDSRWVSSPSHTTTSISSSTTNKGVSKAASNHSASKAASNHSASKASKTASNNSSSSNLSKKGPKPPVASEIQANNTGSQPSTSFASDSKRTNTAEEATTSSLGTGSRKRSKLTPGGKALPAKKRRENRKSHVGKGAAKEPNTLSHSVGTKVATTGETSSRLKRAGESAGSSAAAAGSADSNTAGGTTGSCASTSAQSTSRRRSRGGSGAASGPTASGGGAGVSLPSASGAHPTDMSTSGGGNAGQSGGGASGGAGGGASRRPVDDLPPALQAMTGGMLSELLLGAADGGAATAGGGAPPGGASASDPNNAALDPEMHRLQAMLEARGVPPHLFGALGSSMRHILHRSMNNGAMGKVQSLIKGMQAKEDEGQQLTAVMEMCQVLVMGNEDSLAGFPVKQVVPELVSLLHMEHNFDIMNHACRALTYMLEALPRSSPMVVEAVPALLDKLKCIQCMDVAEQSLTALDMLSKRHNKNLLQAGAISACLMYLDFFSTAAQRSALSVAANCCNNISTDEFHYVQDSLPLLSSKLLTADKKSVESVCTCFSRLVDNLHHDEKILKQLAAHEMLANILKLLEVAPPVISSPTFTMVIRMFVLMCTNCTELAVCLLRQSVSNTLVYLLCGQQSAPSNNIELVSRSPQELFEIVSLIGELMPALPTTGLFSVDTLLKKHPSVALSEEEVTWQWKDDKGNWKSYSAIDSRIIEAAYEASEEEVSLSAMGRMYTVDFTMMQQINEETGTSRPVLRSTDSGVNKRASNISVNSATTQITKPDARADVLAEQPQLATNFIKSLFGILYEVYSSSAGPAVRHKCLQAILRQIYYASPELLSEVLCNQPVSSHIASMLASQDQKVVVGALQMADILMRKLPDTFTQYFQRQGVTHQIKRLAGSASAPSVDITDGKEISAGDSSTNISKSSTPSKSAGSSEKLSSNVSLLKKEAATPTAASASPTMSTSSLTPAGTPGSLGTPGSASKQKRSSKRTSRGKNRSNTAESQSGDSTTGAGATSSARPKSSHKKEGSSSKLTKSSFLASLHPSRWASRNSGAGTSSAADKTHTAESKAVSTAALIANYREKIKSWITTHASGFMTEHFSQLNMSAMKAEGVLHTLCGAAAQLQGADRGDDSLESDREALETIAEVVKNEDVSPFEMIHSGVIEKLLTYLTSTVEISSTTNTAAAITDCYLPHETRLAVFLNVFIGSPLDPASKCNPAELMEECRLNHLITKTMSCLHQQEQFQVKVHDLGMGGGNDSSTNAMKFFSTHQLKCQLQRHPDCKHLKQWKGGAVKVDPLALVQAIERYLIIRGYCRTKSTDSTSGGATATPSSSAPPPPPPPVSTPGSSGPPAATPVTPGSATSDNTDLENMSDDGDSEDELDDSMAAMLMAQNSGRHKLEFLIGDKVLSYNMTVYQAIRNHGVIDSSEQEAESDHGLGGSSIWTQTHLIWYRQASEPTSSNISKSGTSTTPGSANKKSRSDSGGKSTRGSSAKSRKSSDFFIDGVVSPQVSPLITSLSHCIREKISIKDSSVESLSLIRALHAINTYWGALYNMLSYKPVVIDSEFISSKLTAKANRQLQDPLVIMTGNIPQWLPQVAAACPFLFPFETRQMLFYVCSFDRDRAMMRLQESGSEAIDNDSSSRVAPPRLEKKKRTVNRDNIIKQSESIMDDLANSKALLEIQYENEVGTGLGPTLEFYSLVSKELQAADLDLWHGSTADIQQKDGVSKSYIQTTHGLYPKPLARNAKSGTVNKIKSKYKFMGKLLAKALMDSRILDLPLSPIVYSWLLGQQKSLTPSDLHTFDTNIAQSYTQLKSMSDKVKDIRADKQLSTDETHTQISSVGIEDLCLDFTLPGYDNIQLKKGGKDENVSADNIDEYLQLLCHWIFSEGIYRQMESMREGFECVFSSSQLSDLFSSHELEQLFCGNKSVKWETKELFDCCRADHGYTMDSKTVHNLFELLASYTSDEQRKFLSFVTGSPRLPVGGFRSLNPALTIVRKTFDTSENPDDFLPSVMTCVNYLKLPDYSDIDIMRNKLNTAATIGQLSFHLS